MFNRIAEALVRFELIHYNHWFQTAELISLALSASLLVKDGQTQKLLINFDSNILQMINDAKYISSLGMEIPLMAKQLLVQETSLKHRYTM